MLLGVAVAVAPSGRAEAAQARLVNCDGGTCLRLSGHRANAAVAVRLAGQALPVEGGRAWRMTVPLRTARDWRRAPDGTLALSLSDPSTGIETVDAAALPPGALGRQIDLVMLVVRAP